MSSGLAVVRLGRTAYSEALDMQRRVALARIAGDLPEDILILVEHPPVVTVGRSTGEGHLKKTPEQLASLGVELHEIDRGGDVTYHGPGQLVGYLIYDLSEHRQDLHWFLRTIETALIDSLASFGIEAGRNPGLTGVWVDDRKIASIGIHVKQWVTWHGFALNVATDLDQFDLIVPCGIDDVVMTSVERELRESASPELWDRATESTARAVAAAFGQQEHPVAPTDLFHRP